MKKNVVVAKIVNLKNEQIEVLRAEAESLRAEIARLERTLDQNADRALRLENVRYRDALKQIASSTAQMDQGSAKIARRALAEA